jgi:hypothetical protein
MKKILKILGWVLLISIILIQFIRPSKNISTGENPNALAQTFDVPADVKPFTPGTTIFSRWAYGWQTM